MSNDNASLAIYAILTILPLLATASSLVPSTWRVLNNPTGIGLSLCACLSSAFSMVCWLTYSIHQGLLISAVSAAFFVPLSAVMLYLCLKRGGVRDNLKPAFVLFAAVLVAALTGGATAVAFVLGFATLAEIPQLHAALRGDVPALSTLGYGLTVLRTVPWLPYALEHHDIALILWVITCGTVNVAMFVALLLTRGARRRAAASMAEMDSAAESVTDWYVSPALPVKKPQVHGVSADMRRKISKTTAAIQTVS